MLLKLESYETTSKINFKVTDLKYIKEDLSLHLTSKAYNSLSSNGEFMMLKNLFPILSSMREGQRQRERQT